VVACPICVYEHLAELYTLCDDRYGYPNNVCLAVCGDCGHKFADQQLGADVLQTRYTRYYQREASDPAQFSPYEAPGKLRRWLNGVFPSAAWWVPSNVRVLDIACGLGSQHENARRRPRYGSLRPTGVKN
jgi:hypothetical protein